ncbi:MAG: PD40 domain-containing protein [Bacteroidia bacterium]|nr:PD40 domain-containing protein [Bacteroidia bacterium]
MFRYFLVLSCVVLSSIAFAQTSKKYDIADADEHYSHHNYLMALPMYKELLKNDKNNASIQYKIAECYLNTNINKSEAIKYLEFCTKEPKVEANVWLRLGEAYRLSNKIDEAIKAFEKYKELEPKKKKIADRQLEICANAKTLMLNPVNVSFTNLGKEINSEFADYYPWITQDESFLAFTTRRKGQTAGRPEVDGYYASDVYTSRVEAGKWIKAENPGPKINSSLDEQVVGLKSDGSEMLIYIDHIDKFGDIYSTVKKNGMWVKYLPFPEHINKKIEHSASISPDGNTLFFIRGENREDQTDIYICRKLPNGNWSEPFKMGPEINTEYHEDFPYLSTDGVTLYFSSEGHNTMGGFDLFKSVWNPEENTWTKAENLGYPVNTTDNDRSICLTSDNRVGYISALRPGGQGDLDLYRIKFNDVDQKLTLYLGAIMLGDSLNQPKEYIANILAINVASNEEFSFSPNPTNGKFVMALPAGSYEITVTSDGFSEVKDKLTVSDLGLPISEEKKNYKLLKQ